MSNKSKSAFRTIAEVANEIGVATHVLRFWETKFKEISPMKASGGRRYYRPDDVALIKLIRDLLYEKRYTIEGVQKIFKEHGAKAFLNGDIQKDFFDTLASAPQEKEEISLQTKPDVAVISGMTQNQKDILCHIHDELLTVKNDLIKVIENN